MLDHPQLKTGLLRDVRLSPRANSWVTVGALGLIYTYAFADRQILALLVNSIRNDLGLSDTQMSILLGLSFALLYSVLNLPAGYLVDRLNRRVIIGVGALTWSLMTLLSGLSTGFWQLCVARAGVGLGEAVVGPASYSIIRDSISTTSRARAFSIYNMASYLGAALALVLGGRVFAAAGQGKFSNWPIIAHLQAWQIVLVLAGFVGLPIVALLGVVKERRRSFVNGGLPFLEVYAHLKSKRLIYASLAGYATFSGMVGLASAVWLPAMLGRKFGLSPGEIGPVLGGIIIACGPAGMLTSGTIVDYLTARGRDVRAFGAIAAAATMVSAIVFPLVPSLTATWVLYGFSLACSSAFQIVGSVTLAQMTPPSHMGKITALYFLPQNIFGAGLGPTVVAALSDGLFQGAPSLPYALSLNAAVTGSLGLISLYFLRSALRASKLTKPVLE